MLKQALVLVDNAIGNSNQARALARLLQLDYTEVKLDYNFLAELPFIPGNGLKILKNPSSKLTDCNYKVIISSGRRASIIASAIKKMNSSCKIIQLLKPAVSLINFDLVILPYHDRKNYISYPNNVLFSFGAVSYLPVEELEEERLKWQPIFTKYKKPYLAVLIGGNSRKCRFLKPHIEEFIRLITDVAKKYQGTLLISASRRTPELLTKMLLARLSHIKRDYFFYDNTEYAQNPYKALLSNADQIITTGDSISMCSEACSLTKPVYIFERKGMLSSKHENFVNNLVKNNLARRLLNTDLEHFKPNISSGNNTLIQEIKNHIDVL